MRASSRHALAVGCTMWLLSGVAAHGALIPALPPNAQPLIVTPGDPSLYVVLSPGPLDPVARLTVTMTGGTYGCSGSLLGGGQYLLTAAHCVSDGSAGGSPTVLSLTARFNDGQILAGATYYVPPGWTGDFNDGNDIALVGLAASPVGITGYDIWRGADPWGAVIDVAGYGYGGSGSAGYNASAYPFGTLRAGQNELDPVSSGDAYLWDFDSGIASNDTLCILIGVCSQGLGDLEVMIAPGDSGGPSFYAGQLLGVHSFGATFGAGVGDIDNLLNSSYGELAGDTRVNQFTSWIDSILIPEPSSMLLLGTGLAALLCAVRLRRGRS